MAPDRPNILVVFTDQQSHNLMSCAGTPWVHTPHLDRLASGGTRFTRAYCANPVCVPSRFALFTGRMPSAIGMRGNGGQGLHPFTPELDRTGLGHQLRAAGYTTWYGGKVHLPVQLTPERLGFTTFSKDERERLATETAALIHRERGPTPWAIVASLINPHDICLHAIRELARPDDGSRDHSFLARLTTELANLDEALRPPPGADPATWIDTHCPPLPDNHEPQDDEPELVETILRNRPFKIRARREWPAQRWRLHRWAYARLTERVDRQIGVILDALDASGQADNTLVVFTSDHGDHAGAHKLEHKTFFYDEAARVPWILRLPGRIPANTVDTTHTVNTGLDLFATCCDFAGAPLPPHSRGLSPRALLHNPAAPWRIGSYGENLVSHMFVTDRWKYVKYTRGAHAEQLYDLLLDPGETRNHAASHPAVVSAMATRLTEERAAHAALALGPEVADQAGE